MREQSKLTTMQHKAEKLAFRGNFLPPLLYVFFCKLTYLKCSHFLDFYQLFGTTIKRVGLIDLGGTRLPHKQKAKKKPENKNHNFDFY